MVIFLVGAVYNFILVLLSFHVKPLNCISFKRKHLECGVHDASLPLHLSPLSSEFYFISQDERHFSNVNFVFAFNLRLNGVCAKKRNEKRTYPRKYLRWNRCVDACNTALLRTRYILSFWFIATPPSTHWGSSLLLFICAFMRAHSTRGRTCAVAPEFVAAAWNAARFVRTINLHPNPSRFWLSLTTTPTTI